MNENKNALELIQCPNYGKSNNQSVIKCTCGYFFNKESYKQHQKSII